MPHLSSIESVQFLLLFNQYDRFCWSQRLEWAHAPPFLLDQSEDLHSFIYLIRMIASIVAWKQRRRTIIHEPIQDRTANLIIFIVFIQNNRMGDLDMQYHLTIVTVVLFQLSLSIIVIKSIHSKVTVISWVSFPTRKRNRLDVNADIRSEIISALPSRSLCNEIRETQIMLVQWDDEISLTNE